MIETSDRSRSRFAAVFSSLILIGFLLGSSYPILAGTITAASSSLADVRAAIASANSGDIVLVPAGSATWSSVLTITKGITLQGAGSTSTYIAAGVGGDLLSYEPAAPALNELFRLTGFNFNGKDIARDLVALNLSDGYVLTKVRVDHCAFSDWTVNAIVRNGSVYGCCDNVAFTNHFASQTCDNYCTESSGKWSWLNENVTFGSANQFYYEDCTFDTYDVSPNPIASGQGGRYCARYNIFTNHDSPNSGFQPLFDQHGSYGVSSDAHYAAPLVEVYGNTVYDAHGSNLFDHRGAMALCYNNTIIPGTGTSIGIRNEVMGGIVDNILPVASPNGETKRIHKTYFWGNRNSSGNEIVPVDIAEQVNYGGSLGLVPQANRDFFQETAVFDGTSGVGVGPLSARPATCMFPTNGDSYVNSGVGYWATDTNTLYVATAKNTWTAMYTPYPYPHPLRLNLTVTSPNGGESWEIGSSHAITWIANDYTGALTLTLQRNGADVQVIGIAQASASSYSWTIPNSLVAGGGYTIKIAGGIFQDASDGPFSVAGSSWLMVSKHVLYFGAVAYGICSSPADIVLTNTGTGMIEWAAASSADWISIAPPTGAGSGVLRIGIARANLLPGTYAGIVTVSDPNASHSPQTIIINLKVIAVGEDEPPYGSFDTPVGGSTVNSNVAMAGWALDQVGIKSVKIYRDPVGSETPGSQIFVGDAVFIPGARPDIETAYPTVPGNERAGWGYTLLTNTLPNSGNATISLFSYATDFGGNVVLIGRKTIISDNSHATKPFGDLDTPTPGETATGQAFHIIGWSLTPAPKSISPDGSTITIWVDGVPLGHPTYNIYRADIATLFPGYANSNGAIGSYALNTTKYTNGIHSIVWGVSDSAGESDGIGSRFFNILNPSGDAEQNLKRGILSLDEVVSDSDLAIEGPIFVRRGFDPTIPVETVYPSPPGDVLTVTVSELERVAIYLDPKSSSDLQAWQPGLQGGQESFYLAYRVFGPEFQPLPIGATMDCERGVLYWQLGPGFLGEYGFLIIKSDVSKHRTKIQLNVKIVPKFS